MSRGEPAAVPVVLSWSGGKDSALAAHALRADPRYRLVGLLTTITEGEDVISMHGVPRRLLELQAEALDLPLHVVPIPPDCPNTVWEARMGAAFAHLHASGVNHIAFGDLFLADLRAYRDSQLVRAGLTGLYPLWGRDTAALARDFVDLGFRAVLCCVDTDALPAAFAGRALDHALLADLPAGVDPCGENGEYHSFVHEGPIFRVPVTCTIGAQRLRTPRFSVCDLLPA